MSKRTRTILFFSFVFLFLLTIPFLTVYTQGYRLDWDNHKLVKTGGMDFGVRPLGVRVFVDGEFHQETNFLFREVIIRNILPRDYTIRIEREGYAHWQKTVAVAESIVTKFSAVRLFPQNPTRTGVGENIIKVYPADDGRTALALRKETGTLDQVRLLSFSGEQLETPVLTLRANERLEKVGWNAESTVAWFITVLGQEAALYTVSTTDPANPVAYSALTNSYRRGTLQTALIIPTPSTTSVFVAPYDSKDQRYSVDSLIIGQEKPISVVEDIRAGHAVGSSLLYLDKDNILIERDMPSGQLTILATTLHDKELALPITLTAENNARAVAVLAGNELFLWQRGYQLTPVSDNASGGVFSPDATKFAYWNGTTASVLWLETMFGPPARERGETEIIATNSNIEKAFWLEPLGAHLVITSNHDVSIAELDGRGGRNIESYTIENSQTFFAPLLQRVYALAEEGILTTFSVE
ncbi:MAG: hypothetical protein WDZ44_01835 [Candidatus Spechtbacterales bacterium]